MLQRQELRKAGLKVTLPRLKILEILEKSACGSHEKSIVVEFHAT